MSHKQRRDRVRQKKETHLKKLAASDDQTASSRPAAIAIGEKNETENKKQQNDFCCLCFVVNLNVYAQKILQCTIC